MLRVEPSQDELLRLLAEGDAQIYASLKPKVWWRFFDMGWNDKMAGKSY